ncbi:MAG: hypothetical protein J0I34_07450 [Pseudonocardia sp.]|uniref:hypothetical protein n=1 Tax=Actinomycetes TaxID=1760 RepID=UPI00086F5D0C|nr:MULTISPECIES: hypothetical protein [Actinomycetes]MBN9108603.1 hypothetical protein [Pseudonocardia sp.]ODU27482.1 MAG: hypothetical protein ABS80_03635 [Pseudonocardia sp. SCN 72-51]ODV07756.1 MAG: hypothetical protein ABT15_06685 [Pseudonocardia sp. SCN 73-27]
MSAEIEQYRGGTVTQITGGTPVPALPPANDVDGWIRVVADISKLAAQVAHTDFVPRAMQGKPAAVAAAMLAGREMGIGPMTSLQNIHVISGKPGQSALLMRAMVLAKGHQIEYVETTDSRAVLRGRRANEEEWTEVEFTAEQARKAKIDLGGYPADKLVARASARLCRRKFADVISGMAYTLEELQDGDAQLIEAGETHAPPGDDTTPEQPPRTAQRATRRKAAPKTPAAAVGGGTAAGTGAAAPSSAGPPLPGEDGYDAPGDEHEDRDPNRPSSPEQNRLMHAMFRKAELGGQDDRDDRLRLTGLLLKRQLDTSKGLTVADASLVIDALSQLESSGHPDGLAGAAADLLTADDVARAEATMAAEAEQEAAEQEAADDDARTES